MIQFFFKIWNKWIISFLTSKRWNFDTRAELKMMVQWYIELLSEWYEIDFEWLDAEKKNGGCALKWAEKEGNKTTEETPRRQRRVVERRRRTRRFVRRVVFNWLVLFPARPSTLAKKAHRSVPELPDRLGGGCSSVRFFLCALLQRRMFLKSRKSCHHFHYSFFFNLSHANGWFHRTFNQIHHSKWVIPLSQGW